MIDSVQQMLEQRRAAIDSGEIFFSRETLTFLKTRIFSRYFFLDSDDSDDSDAWDDWNFFKLSQSVSHKKWVINYDVTVSRATTFCHLHSIATCRHTIYAIWNRSPV